MKGLLLGLVIIAVIQQVRIWHLRRIERRARKALEGK